MTEDRPAFLVAYPFLSKWQASRILPRRWCLDSGAWSVANAGHAPIDLGAYIDEIKRLRDGPMPPAEVFALDVIGDWRASQANTDRMCREGIEAIPCYHYGEPWDVLYGLAQDYPKIALGGAAQMQPAARLRWAGQCFARVHPKPMHGFSFCARAYVLALPWDSVDSTAWFLQAIRYSRMRTANGDQIHVAGAGGKGFRAGLRGEIEYYLRLEREARVRWHNPGLTLYLAHPGSPPPTGFEMEVSV